MKHSKMYPNRYLVLNVQAMAENEFVLIKTAKQQKELSKICIKYLGFLINTIVDLEKEK